MLQKGIYQLLTDDATLTALGVDISPMQSDVTKVVPLITYIVEDDYIFSKVTSDLSKAEVEFMIVSDNYIEMNDIAVALLNVLDKYTGTVAGVTIHSVDVVGADEQRDKTNDLYMKSIIFDCLYQL